MISEVLAKAMRPETLDGMVGQKKLVRRIRRVYKNGKHPNWMFIGETGCGKTTLARILAVSLQCTHQKKFGVPCKDCYRNYHRFDIIEINASDITGIDALRDALQGVNYAPRPGSRFRIYILDEAQMLSKHAQNLCLKYFEDKPIRTLFIICTTDREAIRQTLQRRCFVRTVNSLDRKGARILIKRALKSAHSELDYLELAEAIAENNITSAGKIMNAVDDYISGATAEEAAQVDVSTDVDVYKICRSAVKGLWPDVAAELKNAHKEDTRGIRSNVAKYLQSILLDEDDFSSRTKVVAEAISRLASLAHMEDTLQLAATVAVLYDVCRYFRNHRR